MRLATSRSTRDSGRSKAFNGTSLFIGSRKLPPVGEDFNDAPFRQSSTAYCPASHRYDLPKYTG
jgi:hypothetical protein